MTVQDGQQDRVAASAHLRRLNVGVVFWFDAQTGIHGIGGYRIVSKRSVQLVIGREIEVAVDLVLQEIAQTAVRGRRHAVEHQTTVTIAPKTAIPKSHGRGMGSENKIYFEIFFRGSAAKTSLPIAPFPFHPRFTPHLPLA